MNNNLNTKTIFPNVSEMFPSYVNSMAWSSHILLFLIYFLMYEYHSSSVLIAAYMELKFAWLLGFGWLFLLQNKLFTSWYYA